MQPPRERPKPATSSLLSGTGFLPTYLRCCADCRLEPFFPIVESAKINELTVDVDFLPQPLWKPLILALKKTTAGFKAISIRSGQTNDVVHLPTCSEHKHPVRKARRESAPCALDGATIEKLCKALSHVIFLSQNLARFELCGIPLNKNVVYHIACALPQCPHLKHLSLKDSLVGDDGAKDVISVLRSLDSLRSICLSGCDLTDRGTGAVTSLLQIQQQRRNISLWRSDLRNFEPQPRSDRHPAAAVGVQQLDLSNNYFGVHFAKHLARVLHDDIDVTHLNLSVNSLGHDAVRFLVMMLRHNLGVQYCDMSHNPGAASYLAETGTSPSSEEGGVFLGSTCGPGTLCYVRVKLNVDQPALLLGGTRRTEADDPRLRRLTRNPHMTPRATTSSSSAIPRAHPDRRGPRPHFEDERADLRGDSDNDDDDAYEYADDDGGIASDDEFEEAQRYRHQRATQRRPVPILQSHTVSLPRPTIRRALPDGRFEDVPIGADDGCGRQYDVTDDDNGTGTDDLDSRGGHHHHHNNDAHDVGSRVQLSSTINNTSTILGNPTPRGVHHDTEDDDTMVKDEAIPSDGSSRRRRRGDGDHGGEQQQAALLKELVDLMRMQVQNQQNLQHYPRDPDGTAGPALQSPQHAVNNIDQQQQQGNDAPISLPAAAAAQPRSSDDDHQRHVDVQHIGPPTRSGMTESEREEMRYQRELFGHLAQTVEQLMTRPVVVPTPATPGGGSPTATAKNNISAVRERKTITTPSDKDMQWVDDEVHRLHHEASLYAGRAGGAVSVPGSDPAMLSSIRARLQAQGW